MQGRDGGGLGKGTGGGRPKRSFNWAVQHVSLGVTRVKIWRRSYKSVMTFFSKLDSQHACSAADCDFRGLGVKYAPSGFYEAVPRLVDGWSS